MGKTTVDIMPMLYTIIVEVNKLAIIRAQYWLEQIRQQRKTKKEVDDVYNNFTKFINTLKVNQKKKRESANRRRKLNAINGPSPRR